MKPSELASISVIALAIWGAVFIFFRAIDVIQWQWYWVMLPIFLALMIYIVMIVILYAKSRGIGR